MKIIESIEAMQQWSLAERAQKKTIAFVPTMGALHAGHLSLLAAGKTKADRLVLSIYVNPTQFGPKEDFAQYPRTLEADLEMAKSSGVDAVFLPTNSAMYPVGTETFVEVGPLGNVLCGKARPGHFRGVATVVLKLFNSVLPDVALFGQKDFQQLRIIEQMVADFNLPVQICGMPIVREPDGLAMSSRNRHLTPAERKRALVISQTLEQAKLWAKHSSAQALTTQVRHALEQSCNKIDYVSLCHPQTLQEMSEFKTPALLAIACFVGTTRLIDNVVL